MYEFSRRISPWHDIPLRPGSDPFVINFVNEIPRGYVLFHRAHMPSTRAKLEISTSLDGNPIVQDVKKGKLRNYALDSVVNYGCVPQTWEDPSKLDPLCPYKGDNDPLDVCEIGSRVASVGQVYPVRVLGVLGLIDGGEMDWKIIAIDDNNPEFEDITDVPESRLSEILCWFRDYKIPEGGARNAFAFDGSFQDRNFACQVIEHTHSSYKSR